MSDSPEDTTIPYREITDNLDKEAVIELTDLETKLLFLQGAQDITSCQHLDQELNNFFDDPNNKPQIDKAYFELELALPGINNQNEIVNQFFTSVAAIIAYAQEHNYQNKRAGEIIIISNELTSEQVEKTKKIIIDYQNQKYETPLKSKGGYTKKLKIINNLAAALLGIR